MRQVQLTGLYVYPVKSLKGIALEEARLTLKGLAHDRRWMVVRTDGRFVTQRDEPRLALIRTRLASTGVVLGREGHGELALPFDGRPGEPIDTRVWGDDCKTTDEGAEASEWLTAAVGSEQPLRIVRMAPGFRRTLTQADRFGADTTTLFADTAPFLVANEASLEELNRVLCESGIAPVPMDRFRPNIVIRGIGAFAENGASRLAGNGFCISLVDHCVRCLVTTVDQATGVRDPSREPYLTLRQLNPAPTGKASPVFGQNATLAFGDGQTIRLGASLTLED